MVTYTHTYTYQYISIYIYIYIGTICPENTTSVSNQCEDNNCLEWDSDNLLCKVCNTADGYYPVMFDIDHGKYWKIDEGEACSKCSDENMQLLEYFDDSTQHYICLAGVKNKCNLSFLLTIYLAECPNNFTYTGVICSLASDKSCNYFYADACRECNRIFNALYPKETCRRGVCNIDLKLRPPAGVVQSMCAEVAVCTLNDQNVDTDTNVCYHQTCANNYDKQGGYCLACDDPTYLMEYTFEAFYSAASHNPKAAIRSQKCSPRTITTDPEYRYTTINGQIVMLCAGSNLYLFNNIYIYLYIYTIKTLQIVIPVLIYIDNLDSVCHGPYTNYTDMCITLNCARGGAAGTCTKCNPDSIHQVYALGDWPYAGYNEICRLNTTCDDYPYFMINDIDNEEYLCLYSSTYIYIYI